MPLPVIIGIGALFSAAAGAATTAGAAVAGAAATAGAAAAGAAATAGAAAAGAAAAVGTSTTVAGAAAVAGAYGVKKAVDASDKMDEARWNNMRASKIVEEGQEKLEVGQKATAQAIKDLGKLKIEVLSTNMKSFLENFSKLKKVQSTDSDVMSEIQSFNPNTPEYQELYTATIEASDVVAGGIGAIAGGTLLAYGAYTAVGSLAVASTGASIAGLSGVAATNATLAWFGGGSLAAGGFGVSGGMAVLGGVVAGPMLALGGVFLSAKADEALYQSKENKEMAKAFAVKCNNATAVLNAIEARANQIGEVIDKLDTYFKDSVVKLEKNIIDNGVDFSKYSKAQKQDVYKSVQIAKTMKAILDTSLLTEKGNLSQESETILISTKEKIEAIEISE